jgi:hypothetical protein
MGGSKTMRAFTLERSMPYLFALGYIVFFVVQVCSAEFAPLFDGARDSIADYLSRIGPR